MTEWVSMAKDLGILLTVSGTMLGPPCLLVWRYVVRPKLILPAIVFHRRVDSAAATVERLEPMMAAMAEHIGPNGGKSLICKVDQLTARVSLLIDDLPWPTFEASSDGHNTRVNHMFERTFGYSSAEMLGQGWKNLLHPSDASDYYAQWEAAVRDVRTFRAQSVRFVTKDRYVMNVMVTATPYVQNQMVTWMGTVRVSGIDMGKQLAS